MKAPIKTFIAVIVLSVSSSAFAMMEFPFCPGGGPPGWFNYFTDRHEHNRWRRQNTYPMSYPPASYYQGSYYPADDRHRADNMPPVRQRTNVDADKYPRHPAQYNRRW